MHDLDTSANEINNHLKKIKVYAHQWKISFNPDPLKQSIIQYISDECCPQLNIYLYLSSVINDSVFKIMMLIERGILLKNHVSCNLYYNHMAQWNLFDVVNSVILKFPADDL